MLVMTYRALDSQWDYTWGQGINNFLSGASAVGQAIATRIKLWLTEWFYDTSDGTPFYQGILGYAGTNKETVDALLVERIMNTRWKGQLVCTSMIFMSSSYNSGTRLYTFTCTVDTIFGSVTLSNIPPTA